MRKTIVRLDLKGLQKRFKALDAITASKMKGRTVYLDKSGNYLGQVGTSYTMKFLDEPYQFSQVVCTADEDAGSYFSELSTSDQKDIISNRLPAGANVEIEVTTKPGEIMGWRWNTILNGYRAFCYDPNHISFNNFKNFESNMAHEHYHYNNGHDDDQPAYEIQAILAQINHSSYNETTNAHKLNTAEYLFKQWKELKIHNEPGYTMADAYRICKYTGTPSY